MADLENLESKAFCVSPYAEAVINSLGYDLVRGPENEMPGVSKNGTMLNYEQDDNYYWDHKTCAISFYNTGDVHIVKWLKTPYHIECFATGKARMYSDHSILYLNNLYKGDISHGFNPDDMAHEYEYKIILYDPNPKIGPKRLCEVTLRPTNENGKNFELIIWGWDNWISITQYKTHAILCKGFSDEEWIDLKDCTVKGYEERIMDRIGMLYEPGHVKDIELVVEIMRVIWPAIHMFLVNSFAEFEKDLPEIIREKEAKRDEEVETANKLRKEYERAQSKLLSTEKVIQKLKEYQAQITNGGLQSSAIAGQRKGTK